MQTGNLTSGTLKLEAGQGFVAQILLIVEAGRLCTQTQVVAYVPERSRLVDCHHDHMHTLGALSWVL